MTSTPITIDQAKLFEACNHDTRLTGIVLALLEVVTGEKVTVNFAHQITNSHTEHYRNELLKALGID